MNYLCNNITIRKPDRRKLKVARFPKAPRKNLIKRKVPFSTKLRRRLENRNTFSVIYATAWPDENERRVSFSQKSDVF